MSSTLNAHSGSVGWGAPVCPSEIGSRVFSTGPNASRHGSGLSFAGYPVPKASGTTVTATLAAVRQDDRVHPPRGRKR
jgi:hypothetical protein